MIQFFPIMKSSIIGKTIGSEGLIENNLSKKKKKFKHISMKKVIEIAH